jgi:uncharacterized membrane protein YphA (DoxX/SURF4 family)
MFTATVIVSSLLALALFASGLSKLRKDPKQLQIMEAVGFPKDKMWLLGVAEIAGTIGLVAGLFWWPIGIAAAIGVILYFIGAIISHLRVKEGFSTPLIVLLVAVAALVLRATTT